MRWSFRIGRLFGIDVKVHVTFFLILFWVALEQWRASKGSAAEAALGVLFVLLLFTCVVLHEMGHALVARRYGVRTRDIVLLPIGGVARLESIPREPLRELAVAAAGPAVNVVIAAGTAGYLLLRGDFAEHLRAAAETPLLAGSIPERLLLVNVFLVLFNLLPAFPMDGGRMLRAILATRKRYEDATHIAAVIGQGMAMLFGFAGLFGNPLLLFIALFVWIGAAQESSMVQIASALAGLPVRRLMLTDFRELAPLDRLQQAVELTLEGSQKDFPVVDGGRVVGVLTQRDLLAALAKDGPQANVASAMAREFQSATGSEMVEPAFRRLQACRCRTMPVLDDQRLVGLLTMDNVGEFLQFQSALRH